MGGGEEEEKIYLEDQNPFLPGHVNGKWASSLIKYLHDNPSPCQVSLQDQATFPDLILGQVGKQNLLKYFVKENIKASQMYDLML